MAIYKEDIVDIELESGSIFRSFLNHTIGEGDSNANRFGIRLFRSGAPVSAEASTVTGLFIAPDGEKYVIDETSYHRSTGTRGNAAWVQLPPVCYAAQGQFTLAIKLSGGDIQGTMRIIDGTVSDTGEEGAAVPTSVIPATADIIAAYEEAVEVVNNSVRYDAEQTLTTEQRETARENIGAAKQSDVEDVLAAIEAETARAAAEEASRVSKPAVNPEGTDGYYLRSKGSGLTEWAPIGIPTDEQVAEAVEGWLDDHPEATTTVEDESLEMEKLSAGLRRMTVNGGSIAPIYVGDYMTKQAQLPSCCVKIGGAFFCIDAPTREAAVASESNAGTIRKFDLETNQELEAFAKDENVGHANSIAYDTEHEKVYVVPIWDTSSGAEVTVKYLYVFDIAMDADGTISTPTTAMGVSYDHVTKTLYYYDYDHKIYALEGSTWSLVTTVDFTGVVENLIYDREYNQDFAIYDGMFYISSPYGNIIYGKLEETTSRVIGSFVVNDIDSSARFHMGELEGMEFDEDGHLYAVNIVGLTSEVRDAFVVELPVGNAISHSTNISGNLFRVHDGTFILSEASQKTFALDTYQIRSITQIGCILLSGNTTRISIPAGNSIVDDYIIMISQNMELLLAGTYTTKYFRVFGGQLAVYPDNESGHLLITTSDSMVFDVTRAGNVKFAGGYALRIETPNLDSGANNFVRIGYSYPITLVRLLPVSVSGINLYVGSTLLLNAGLYYGSTKMVSSLRVTISAGNSATFVVGNSTRATVHTMGTNSGLCGSFEIDCANNGYMTSGTPGAASIGVSTATNRLTITNNHGTSTAIIHIVAYEGAVSAS